MKRSVLAWLYIHGGPLGRLLIDLVMFLLWDNIGRSLVLLGLFLAY